MVTADLDETEILSASFTLVFTDAVFQATELRGKFHGGAGLVAVDEDQDRDCLSSWDKMVCMQWHWDSWLMSSQGHS